MLPATPERTGHFEAQSRRVGAGSRGREQCYVVILLPCSWTRIGAKSIFRQVMIGKLLTACMPNT